MKTDELINMLGTNLEPVKGGELRSALMIALAIGAAAASCLMLAIFGLPDATLGGDYSVPRFWHWRSRWGWSSPGRAF